MVAFLLIQSTAFYCPDIRYLHSNSNPYPPPRLILFPVTLVSKNDPGRDIESEDEEVAIDNSLAIKSNKSTAVSRSNNVFYQAV